MPEIGPSPGTGHNCRTGVSPTGDPAGGLGDSGPTAGCPPAPRTRTGRTRSRPPAASAGRESHIRPFMALRWKCQPCPSYRPAAAGGWRAARLPKVCRDGGECWRGRKMSAVGLSAPASRFLSWRGMVRRLASSPAQEGPAILAGAPDYEISSLAGVHGSRTHLGRVHRRLLSSAQVAASVAVKSAGSRGLPVWAASGACSRTAGAYQRGPHTISIGRLCAAQSANPVPSGCSASSLAEPRAPDPSLS
jgi:hypothetical protein